jgi:hypothetical protein
MPPLISTQRRPLYFEVIVGWRKAQKPLSTSGRQPVTERLAAESIPLHAGAEPMPHPLHIDEEHNNYIRAEVGERLRVMFALAGRQKVPRPIRQSLDRLAELDRKIELKSSPSMVPSDDGWLSRLLPKRFR